MSREEIIVEVLQRAFTACDQAILLSKKETLDDTEYLVYYTHIQTIKEILKELLNDTQIPLRTYIKSLEEIQERKRLHAMHSLGARQGASVAENNETFRHILKKEREIIEDISKFLGENSTHIINKAIKIEEEATRKAA